MEQDAAIALSAMILIAVAVGVFGAWREGEIWPSAILADVFLISIMAFGIEVILLIVYAIFLTAMGII